MSRPEFFQAARKDSGSGSENIRAAQAMPWAAQRYSGPGSEYIRAAWAKAWAAQKFPNWSPELAPRRDTSAAKAISLKVASLTSGKPCQRQEKWVQTGFTISRGDAHPQVAPAAFGYGHELWAGVGVTKTLR